MAKAGFIVAVEPVAIVAMLFASAFFAPCAHATSEAPSTLPRSFAERWCAYRTPHFSLLTDLRRRPALRTVDELNRFRQLFFALFPNASSVADTPLTILVFSRHTDLIEMTGTARYAGVTLPSMYEYRLLAAHGQRRAPTENTLHEYAHYLMRTRTDLHYPLWYEEGLATYLAAANLRRNPVQLGAPPYREIRAVAGDLAVSFQSTLTATSILDLRGVDLATFYGKAWLLTHFIRLGHAAGFPDWRKAFASYLDNPTRDFADAFGLAPAKAEALLLDYLGHRPLPMERFELPAGADPAPTKDCLTPEDRYYELALSILTLNRPIATTALDQSPRTARTLTALSKAHGGERERALRLVDQALALKPTDPDANVQFAHLQVRDCLFSSDSACIGKWADAAERYRRVLNEDSGRYDAAYGLGVAYLHTGRAAQAMRHLRQAYEKMPWDVRINYFLGEGYRIADDPRAAAHLSNARNWALDESWRERAEFALRRLRNRE